MAQAQCRSCKNPIWWTRTGTGSLMPVDPPPPVLTGAENVAVSRNGNGELHARVLTAGEPGGPDERLTVAHFASCPSAAAHRRPR